MTPKAPVVLKFGGAALSSVPRIAARVRDVLKEGAPPVLVVSAREGVTDLLTGLLRRPRARSAHREALRRLAALHPGLPPAGRAQMRRLRRLVRLLERSGGADPALRDRLLSLGERLAVNWLSAALDGAGLATVPVESDHLGLITDNSYGASTVLLERSEAAVRARLLRLCRTGRVPIVTGFFGRSLEGRVATLGRGGSDYSASAIGALLRASRVELVKRDVSVLSADPREVPAARPIERLTYAEAEELAQFGARVLHPLTIEPARQRGVEIRVCSLTEPRRVTTIGPSAGPDGIRALTRLGPLRLLRLRVPGGRQRPGIVSEVSRRLAAAQVNLVQLFTSSAHLCLVLEPGRVRAAVRALTPMTAGSAATLDGPLRVDLVTVIGDGILRDVARFPKRVLAGAEGFSATPRSLSIAVREEVGREALRSLHQALVEGPRR